MSEYGNEKVIAGLSLDESTLLAATGAQFAGDAQMDQMDWTNPESRSLPGENEVIRPFGWRLLVMPMRPEAKSKGGILIPQVRQDTDQYLNYVGRIISLGPLCFRHPKWSNQGFEFDTMAPRRGDWILYNINQYTRIDYRGTKLIILNDDAFAATVPDGVSPWDFKIER